MKTEQILWALAFGVFVGALYAYYQKNILGKFVDALIAAQAFSPENAKSLSELGYEKNKLVKMSLRESSSFSQVIAFVGEEDKKYYIPEETKEKTISRYVDNRTTVTAVLFTALIFALVALLCSLLLPFLLDMLNNLFE